MLAAQLEEGIRCPSARVAVSAFARLFRRADGRSGAWVWTAHDTGGTQRSVTAFGQVRRPASCTSCTREVRPSLA